MQSEWTGLKFDIAAHDLNPGSLSQKSEATATDPLRLPVF